MPGAQISGRSFLLRYCQHLIDHPWLCPPDLKLYAKMLLHNKSLLCCLLIEKIKILPTKQQHQWCENLQITADFLNWQKIYENSNRATNKNNSRLFQIRLNLRSIVTQFHGFKPVDDNMGKFCEKKTGTLMHLFCDCETVVGFWNNASDFISSRLPTNIVFSKQHMLIGLDNKSSIFLFGKWITNMC